MKAKSTHMLSKPPVRIVAMVLFLNAAGVGCAEPFEPPRNRWDPRLWETVDGKEMRASLVRVDGEDVLLKKDGAVYRVPITRIHRAYHDVFDPLVRKGEVLPFELSPEGEEAVRGTGLKPLVYRREEEGELRFLLHVPEGADLPGARFPLVVYLTGTGGSGTGNYEQMGDGEGILRKFLPIITERPCFVMIPQYENREDDWTGSNFIAATVTMWRIVQALEVLPQTWPSVDRTRLYATGLSLGGKGALELVVKFPGLLAAAVPVACDYYNEAWRRDSAVPVWMFINRGDEGVHVPDIDKMREVYRGFGGDFRVTWLDGKGHNAWTEAFGEKSFRAWLFRQSQNDPRWAR